VLEPPGAMEAAATPAKHATLASFEASRETQATAQRADEPKAKGKGKGLPLAPKSAGLPLPRVPPPPADAPNAVDDFRAASFSCAEASSLFQSAWPVPSPPGQAKGKGSGPPRPKGQCLPKEAGLPPSARPWLDGTRPCSIVELVPATADKQAESAKAAEAAVPVLDRAMVAKGNGKCNNKGNSKGKGPRPPKCIGAPPAQLTSFQLMEAAESDSMCGCGMPHRASMDLCGAGVVLGMGTVSIQQRLDQLHGWLLSESAARIGLQETLGRLERQLTHVAERHISELQGQHRDLSCSLQLLEHRLQEAMAQLRSGLDSDVQCLAQQPRPGAQALAGKASEPQLEEQAAQVRQSELADGAAEDLCGVMCRGPLLHDERLEEGPCAEHLASVQELLVKEAKAREAQHTALQELLVQERGAREEQVRQAESRLAGEALARERLRGELEQRMAQHHTRVQELLGNCSLQPEATGNDLAELDALVQRQDALEERVASAEKAFSGLVQEQARERVEAQLHLQQACSRAAACVAGHDSLARVWRGLADDRARLDAAMVERFTSLERTLSEQAEKQAMLLRRVGAMEETDDTFSL